MVNLTCQVYNKKTGDNFNTGNEDIDFLNKYNETYDYTYSDNEDTQIEANRDFVLKEPNVWNLDFTKPFDYNTPKPVVRRKTTKTDLEENVGEKRTTVRKRKPAPDKHLPTHLPRRT